MDDRCHVAQLPTELLEDIFFYTYVDHSLTGHTNPSRDAPLNIAGVSTSWRDIVLHTPMLWSSMCINVHCSPESTRCSPPHDIIKLWLTRSGSFPLTFAVTLSSPADRIVHSHGQVANWNPGIELVMTTLVARLEQWQNVYFNTNQLSRHLKLNLIPIPDTNICLQKLEVDLGVSRTIVDLLNSVLSRSADAVLETFSSYGKHHHWVGLPNQGGKLNIPYQNISSLTIERCSDWDSRSIIRAAPHLRQAQIHLTGVAHIDPNHHITPFSHDTLESLAIYCSGEVWMWFHHYTFPALTHLSVNSPESQNWRGDAEADFLDFLGRSAAPIVDLEFRATPISTPALVETLRYVSSTLERFGLHLAASLDNGDPGTGMTKDLLLSLSRAPRLSPGTTIATTNDVPNVLGDALLCPHLQDLSLQHAIHSEVEDGIFSDMIQSRFSRKSSAQFSRIRRVNVRFAMTKYVNDVKRLEDMYTRGLFGRAAVARWAVLKESKNSSQPLLKRDPLGKVHALLPYTCNWTNRYGR